MRSPAEWTSMVTGPNEDKKRDVWMERCARTKPEREDVKKLVDALERVVTIDQEDTSTRWRKARKEENERGFVGRRRTSTEIFFPDGLGVYFSRTITDDKMAVGNMVGKILFYMPRY